MGTNVKYGTAWPVVSGMRYYEDYAGNKPNIPPTTYGGYVSRYTYGETIPNFRKRKAAGELLPHTPFEQWSKSRHQATDYEFRMEKGSPSLWWEGSGINFDHWPEPQVVSTADTSSASYFLQVAAAEIYGNSFDALTALAELGDVKRLFSGVSRKLTRMIKDPGKYNEYLTTDQVGDIWLGTRYGILPLINDLTGLYDAIMNYDAARKIWSQRSGTSYTDYSNETRTFDFGTLGHWHIVDEYETTHSIRGSVTAEFTPPRISTNPLVTGWEVVPFSFMVDWVVGVGKALQAASLQAQAKGVASSIGVHSETIYEGYHIDPTPDPTYTYKTFTGSTFKWSAEKSVRTPASIPTLPQMTGRSADPTISLDLLTLMRSVLAGKSNRR